MPANQKQILDTTNVLKKKGKKTGPECFILIFYKSIIKYLLGFFKSELLCWFWLNMGGGAGD